MRITSAILLVLGLFQTAWNVSRTGLGDLDYRTGLGDLDYRSEHDSPPSIPPKELPHLPPLPTVPVTPTPVPDPGQAVTIYDGEQFVVDWTGECVVAGFPPSALKVSHRFVPDKQSFVLDGAFTDGDKVVVGEREYVGPTWVYRCRVAEACDQCWLMVLPVGGNKDSMQVRLLKCVKGPRPPPGPVPPEPKPPDPKPPVPVDPLVAAFQAAYTADPDPDKATLLPKVIAAMDGLVEQLKATGKVLSTKQLQDSVKANTDAAIGTGKMPVLGKAVATYLVSKFGTTNQAMTDALWVQAQTEYATVVKALRRIR